MLNKRHNPVATFFILLTIVGVAKPAKALVEGQNEPVMTSISEVSISSTTQDARSAWNQSPNPSDIAAIASGAELEKSQKFIESQDRENGITRVNSISALDTYINNGDRDSSVSLNFVADTDIGDRQSSTNADKNLNANFDLEDSGSVNPTLEDSGSVEPDLEDSGEINFDLEGSGESESGVNLKDSGSVEPDLEDSGLVEPDLKDSGQTISSKAGDSTIVAQDDNIAPNGVENETPPTRESQWWWWLPLIIGIPVVAAIVILNGQKKGDREPAIDNVRDLNTPDRDIDVSGTSGRENLSAVGANVGNVDRVDNTISTATLAEGATTNFVSDRARAEDNIDLDIDRSDLENTDSVTEIPSTSVSEFTGYETKLQTGDNSTKLQDDDLDLESIDNIPPINPIDNVAASELVTDFDFKKTTADSTIEVSEVGDTKLNTNTVDPLSSLSIPSDRIREDTSNNIVEGDTAVEDVEAKEFRGDYVLEEETQGFSPYQQADADLDSTETARSNKANFDLETESSELDLSKPDVAVSEVADIDSTDAQQVTDREVEVRFDGERDLDIGDRTISSDEIAFPAADFQPLLDTELVDEQNNETVNELDLDPEIESSESDLSEPDVAVSEVADTDIISEPQDTVELATNEETIEVIGFDSDLYLEPTQTNLDLDEPDRANAQRLDDSDRSSEEATDDNVTDDFEVVDISIEEIRFDDSEDSSLEEMSLDDDSTQTIDASLDEISFNDSEDTSIEEIRFDDSEDSSLEEISLDDDSTQTIDASLDEISFNDSEDTSIEEIRFNDSENTSLEEMSLDDDSTQTIDTSLDEISFDDSENTSLEEMSFDDSEDSSLEEMSFDDSQFDEMSLDDSTQTIDASLDEISFDDSEDTSFDEMSLDDSQFDEMSLDDNSTQTIDASLDEISFDDSEDSSLEEMSFDDSQFDEMSLDDNSTQTIDAGLDEISFDDSEDASSNKIDDSNSDEVSYEELDKAQADLTLDLLSNNTAGITSLSDDESEDMNNITEWLESLETPKQSTDNILEWLDSLNTDDTDSVPDSDRNRESEENDISFQFIEDLLDDDPKQDK